MYKSAAKNSQSRAFRNAFNGKSPGGKSGKKKRGAQEVPKNIKSAMKDGRLIAGVIEYQVKGGLRISLANIAGFCPFSEFPKDILPKELLRIIKDRSRLLFKVIRAEKVGSIIVSRIKAYEKQGLMVAKNALDKNICIVGKVKEVKDYGAFVDIGGIDGLVHVSKLPLGKIPEKGQRISVKVLAIDIIKNRISLSALP